MIWLRVFQYVAKAQILLVAKTQTLLDVPMCGQGPYIVGGQILDIVRCSNMWPRPRYCWMFQYVAKAKMLLVAKVPDIVRGQDPDIVRCSNMWPSPIHC